MQTYEVTTEDLTKTANSVKECLLHALERDGLLTKKAEEICQTYAVVVSKPGWFGRWFRAVRNEEKPGFVSIDIMKLV